MSKTKQDLGQRLRQRRIALGLSQDRVAEGVGINRTTVVSAERNCRRTLWGTLEDIQEFLAEQERERKQLEPTGAAA